LKSNIGRHSQTTAETASFNSSNRVLQGIKEEEEDFGDGNLICGFA